MTDDHKHPSEETLKAAALNLPQSLSAEAAVLGSMLIDPDCIDEIRTICSAESFFHIAHRQMYEAILTLADRGDGLDAVILRNELVNRGVLDEVGGVEYLARVLQTVPSSANALYYARIVEEKHVLRSLMAAAREVIESVIESDMALDELLDQAERKIFSVTERRQCAEARAIGETVRHALETILRRISGEITGLKTGYPPLDEITGGLGPGEMIVVAGRPSMGKTAFVLNMVWHMALEQGKSILIFSLEMSAQALSERMLSGLARIDAQRLRTGKLDHHQMDQILHQVDALAKAPIYIDDRSVLSAYAIRASARRRAKQHPIALIVIDYLQLLSGSQRASRESRQQEITDISAQCKSLARELQIPVLVVSQLNRAAEIREDHRPRLSDLRESGSIEQDADVVLMLHREAYYHKGDIEWENENWQTRDLCEVIVAKQRNGPTGSVPLVFLQPFGRFETVSMSPEAPTSKWP